MPTLNRLRKLTPSTARGAIVASAGIVMIFGIVQKLFGFARDILIAGQFGAGGATDALLVAQNLPLMITGAISTALSVSVLPVVTKLRVEGKTDDARVVISIILNAVLLITAAAAAICILLAAPLIRLAAPGLAPQATAIAAGLTRVFFIAYVFMSMTAVIGLLLNSLKQFAIPALGPIILNIFTIALIVWLAGGVGVYSVAYGFAAGAVVQYAMVSYFLRRNGIHPGAILNLRHPAVRRIFLLALPILAAGLAADLYGVMDNWFASHLTAGSITAKTYGLKVIQMPVGILTVGVSTVFYPTLSERAAHKDNAGLADTVAFGLRMVALVTIPAAVGLAVLRVPIIRALFQHGAWTAEATARTSSVVLWYAIGIFTATTWPIFLRAFQGMQDMWTPLWMSVFNAGVNIFLDWVFIEMFGLIGLPLANTVAVSLSVLVYYLLLRRRVGVGLQTGRLAVALLKITAASAIMGVVVWAGVDLLTRFAPVAGKAQRAGELLAIIVLGVLVYLVGLIVLRLDEVRSFGALVSRVVRRAR
ncbi:MAG: murein biosynthesis integral membrane protein MurJ [Bacillota bacterium]